MSEIESLARIERLLTILVIQKIQDRSKHDQIVLLSQAGLSNTEIANTLGATTAVVAQTLYTARKRSTSTKSGAASIKASKSTVTSKGPAKKKAQAK